MYGYKGFDQTSFDLGMIECFCEMVEAKVKGLALSPAIDKTRIEIIKTPVNEIAKKYNVKYFLEDNMVLSNIAPDSYIKDKYIFFFYQDDSIIKKYLELKQIQSEAITNKTYNTDIRSKISIKLCHLLSYPEERIQEIEAKNV